MRTRLFIVAAFLLLLLAAWALAEDLDGEAIVKKMADVNVSNSSVTETKMILVDGDGTQRVRQLRTRTKKVNGLNQIVTTFLAPPDVRGVKFLVIEKKNADDDQMLYLPALKRVRRITSSNKNDDFMGSTFSYADLQSHDPDKGTHERLKDMTLAGQDCYVVKTIPKNPADYEYSKLIYWVRKDNFVPIRGEFYDKEGKLLKVLEVLKLEKKPDGNWLTKLTKMSNVQKRKVTVLEILNYQVDVAIEDFYFSERFLKDESQE